MTCDFWGTLGGRAGMPVLRFLAKMGNYTHDLVMNCPEIRRSWGKVCLISRELPRILNSGLAAGWPAGLGAQLRSDRSDLTDLSDLRGQM